MYKEIKNLFEADQELFLPTYKRIPIDIEYGEGVHLIDKNGDKYLDFFSGLGVNSLGHSHPKIIEAVGNQIRRFAHLSNSFVTDIQVEFTSLLLKHSKMSKAFLANSGTEATDGAIKLIRKLKGPDRKIFSFTNAFHGRTYGAVTLTPKSKYQKGFEPLLPNIDHINFNDVNDLERKINENTAAIFVEFIQGEGGINPVSSEIVSAMKKLKEKYGFIIVADEIQSGIGRTGKEFAFNHFEIQPDIITTAKAIGGGLPLGALLVDDELKNVLETGKHGTTFGGNPVCCAAGIVVLEEVFENGLMQHADSLGNYLLNELNIIKESLPEKIKDIRGKGLMIGIELSFDGNSFTDNLREKKVLVNCTNNNVLRLLPPLIITKSDADFFLYNFHTLLKEI